MNVRRSSHRTQWAAQFAVASELCKQGYEVAFTMGNHPSVDIMVNSPNRTPLFVDVKGLYKKNFWAVRAKRPMDRLFYVFAFVPDIDQNRFFVLTQLQVNSQIAVEIERSRERALDKGNTKAKPESFPGIGWKFAEQFENAWGVLPS
jgi:hypothetical protein